VAHPRPARPRSARRASAPRGRGLRERKKRATRERLVTAAGALARSPGFDRVTVDDIAAAAEVSRSTFFRYFPGKEAVLFTWREPLLEAFEAELARPVAGERGFATVRRALLAVGALYQHDRTAIVRRQTIVDASPSLVGHEYAVDRAWEEAIARTLIARGGRGARAQRVARLRAGAILGVLRVTLREWIERRGRPDLVRLGREALDLLERDLERREDAARRTG
jgi:AcrR family transcriptional regulator